MAVKSLVLCICLAATMMFFRILFCIGMPWQRLFSELFIVIQTLLYVQMRYSLVNIKAVCGKLCCSKRTCCKPSSLLTFLYSFRILYPKCDIFICPFAGGEWHWWVFHDFGKGSSTGRLFTRTYARQSLQVFLILVTVIEIIIITTTS